MFNKKAQVGETITWLVATLVIVLVLVFFIFGASMLADTKSLKKVFKEGFTSKAVFIGDDLFLRKSVISYFSLDDISKKKLLDKKMSSLEKEGMFRLSYNETKKQIKGRLEKI
jgi:hypothetical protein